MQQNKGPLPNLTLEEARGLISRWQRKFDAAQQDKIYAQSIAFDLIYPEKKTSTLDEVKALVFYYRTELEKAIAKRDTGKAENECLRAENHALKLQLKLQQKEPGK